MLQTTILLAIAVLLLIAALIVVLLRRGTGDALIAACLENLERGQERSERTLREEIAKNREESGTHARQLREEVNASLKGMNDTVVKSLGGISEIQQNRLEAFSNHLGKLTESIEKKLDAVKGAVDERLKLLQEDNSRKLDAMRATVDEKLQGTLEKRLGESFKLVSERLEQVHKGLGEMQMLATGVGDLKRVLTNVKTRGSWGEIQLGALLEQVLTPEQFGRNIATKGGGERVEFAIKLPGRNENREEIVWLPIDAKFPKEDYERLLEAQEAADPDAADAAVKQLENSIKKCAKDICEKYLNPPMTTDFAIMFLPTEGLYAEVVRRVGLTDVIQRDCRVVVAGPSTLWALLNSLQMGFHTLAIQQRSSEVWNLLAAVKTEFGKFGVTLEGVKKKLEQASNEIDRAASKSRTIERKLRDVHELPADDAQNLLLPEPELETEHDQRALL